MACMPALGLAVTETMLCRLLYVVVINSSNLRLHIYSTQNIASITNSSKRPDANSRNTTSTISRTGHCSHQLSESGADHWLRDIVNVTTVKPATVTDTTLQATATASTPTSPTLSWLQLRPQSDSGPHQRLSQLDQPQKWQHGGVECENGVCRLRVASSNKQCLGLRTFTTSYAPFTAAPDVTPTTVVRDAKSVRPLPLFIRERYRH